MARGAVRGAAVAWLGLIALQVATTRRGSAAVAGGFDVFSGFVERALSPDVAAIPDYAHRVGRDEETDAPPATAAPTGGGKTEGTTSTDPASKFPGFGD